MEKRYDLSFMRDYAEIYEKDDRWLAQKFHCGIKIVDKILSGEIKIKEEPLEEILYEFGYKNYEDFKKGIEDKVEEKIRNIKESELRDKKTKKLENLKENIINIITDSKEETIIEKETKKIHVRKDANNEMNTNEIFDYNTMNNIDRIIVSMLCDDDLTYSFKQISSILNIDEEYVKYIYQEVIKSINRVSNIEKEYQKTRI